MPVKPRPFRASACLRRYLNTKAWSVGLDFDVPEEATDSQALPSRPHKLCALAQTNGDVVAKFGWVGLGPVSPPNVIGITA